ncbi:hypothetical protein LPC08_06900 [Roseomonas sp. OT10]|uniref:hypothetical protein n=1 Tax=Roseomonas cutis TaxID=2897332 RepID=UPI001E310CBD|nr:hypothetical protein [Roseomonas sp. OT10]UFN50346.1 hypothetical protein LPC08_06900 [Roseomonas sp. OT10]
MTPSIGVACGPGGELAYAVPIPPEAMPPVPPRALLAAWDTARAAAHARLRGPERALRFALPGAGPGGAAVELRLADPDARCWAEAIDGVVDLSTLPGLAVLLRLLALLDAMGRMPWLRGLFDIGAGGTLLHPSLLAAAADLPLDRAARLDETSLRRRLSRLPAGACA